MTKSIAPYRRHVAGLLLAAVALQSVSCGTIIHPERVGRPHRNQVDPSIALLDALGLLFFFVPGIIAFVVDFSTGAIFLPAYECGKAEGHKREGDFVVVQLDPKDLTRGRIEKAIREATGKRVELDPGAYTARRLDKLSQFEPEKETLARAAHSPSQVLFRAQSR